MRLELEGWSSGEGEEGVVLVEDESIRIRTGGYR